MGFVLGELLVCAVMLVPGAFGNGTSSLFLRAEDYFAEYTRFFESHGCRVKKAQFPPDATIESRSLMLRDQLAHFAHPGEPVWLVAHSQGALDSRYALKTLHLPGVTALVSVGAPQAGTPLADWVLREREREGFWYVVLKWVGQYDLKGLSFAGEMTSEFLKRHAERFEKIPGVGYASARSVCRSQCHWSLRLLDWITGVDLGAGRGDGVVASQSQAWGDDLGEFDLDHISEAGDDALSHPERLRLLKSIWGYLKSTEHKTAY